MKRSPPLILIVEQRSATLANLRRILQSAGYRPAAFSSLKDVQSRLKDMDPPSCAIIDLDLPRSDGVAIQKHLNKAHPSLPVIFISSHPDIPSSVKVIKAGALDLLVTPLHEQDLLKLIHKAVLQERHSQRERHELDDIRHRLNTLTRREAEVLERLFRGLLNKQTAAELGTSEKTIKVHRGRIMKKLQVQSIAELVQFVMRCRTALPRSHSKPAPVHVRPLSAPGPQV